MSSDSAAACRRVVHLLPIAEVGWLRDVDPNLAGYGAATLKPDSVEIHDFLAHTLRISEDVEGHVYLLNPHIVTADGERRFPSFRNLMEDAFQGH